MKIGIFGGSFNPVHLAHLIVAETFTDYLNLDLTLFIPAYHSPFKDRTDYKIKDNDRINMLNIALKSNSKFQIELFEIKNKKISYTINTIEFLKSKYTDSEFYLLIGLDQALNFKDWHEWEKILDSIQICIAKRNDSEYKINSDFIEGELTYKGKKPVFIDSPLIDISSSSIRQRIFNNNSIKYLVSDKVEKYIYNNKLYI